MPLAKRKVRTKKKAASPAHHHRDAVLTHELLDFLAFVAHQLRTPVTVAKGYVAMLLEGLFDEVTPGQKKAYEQIYASCERIVRLINNFLDLPRIHAGTMQYAFKTDSLREIIRQAMSESQPLADLKKIALIGAIPETKMAMRADYENLLQALTNVLDNALKYTKGGSVRVTVVQTPLLYRATIIDTGIGMTKEHVASIFAKYLRVDNLRELYKEGNGLGLYIARKIIEGHGGRIWAESEGLGKGSTFIIELPKQTNNKKQITKNK